MPITRKWICRSEVAILGIKVSGVCSFSLIEESSDNVSRNQDLIAISDHLAGNPTHSLNPESVFHSTLGDLPIE